ncbi:hypothetical protein SXCC_02555 [Gluconacetobacter sp. SXCC-1]|nr:hypothetical protein SXCC_02555 [Gluconacetobacter sp. SXCC-1]
MPDAPSGVPADTGDGTGVMTPVRAAHAPRAHARSGAPPGR